uniref:Ovule protein n=1 Tax=Gongylonema pulchrum TaxID=637853 RepID=A0A183EW07_9BILA
LKQTTTKKDPYRSQRSMSLGSAAHESLLAAVASSSQGPIHTVDLSRPESGILFHFSFIILHHK